ncbi:MAG: class C beta-lactamase-related serine hydrolase [Variovorax sp.]|nr:MAG: class C beta-lactamase-related serine hydrolase [Variovorax sp.]
MKRRVAVAALAAALGAAGVVPSAHAIDSDAAERLQRTIAADYSDVNSVVVLRGGSPLFAYHRNGDPDTLHDVQSVAKSGLSVLVGVALGQGRIASLDQPIVALMPALAGVNADSRAAQVTVRHLLTMTAGFDVGAAGTDRSDGARAAMSRPFKAAPGEAFAYDNPGFVLLSRVLEAAVGQPLPAWADAHLLQPLGIERIQWPGAGMGRLVLGMRTRDMAKLGQLFLQNGRWGDRQLVPADYVRAATQRQNAGGPPVGLPYGYMWWAIPSSSASPSPASRSTFFASGFGGQMVWVHPPLDLVIATTSEVSAASGARGQALKLVRGPLFRAVQAMPPAKQTP